MISLLWCQTFLWVEFWLCLWGEGKGEREILYLTYPFDLTAKFSIQVGRGN